MSEAILFLIFFTCSFLSFSSINLYNLSHACNIECIAHEPSPIVPVLTKTLFPSIGEEKTVVLFTGNILSSLNVSVIFIYFLITLNLFIDNIYYLINIKHAI